MGKLKNMLKSGIMSLALLNGCDEMLNKEPSRESYKEPAYEDEEGQIETDYPNFRFPNELQAIRRHAQRVGVDERLMLAIREAENGGRGRQFGIMPNARYNNDRGHSENGQFHEYPDDNGLSKQASWAAWTIRKNRERFERNNGGHTDFIDYLSERYAPRGAENDPDNLNENWTRNVRARYRAHGGE